MIGQKSTTLCKVKYCQILTTLILNPAFIYKVGCQGVDVRYKIFAKLSSSWLVLQSSAKPSLALRLIISIPPPLTVNAQHTALVKGKVGEGVR